MEVHQESASSAEHAFSLLRSSLLWTNILGATKLFFFFNTVTLRYLLLCVMDFRNLLVNFFLICLDFLILIGLVIILAAAIELFSDVLLVSFSLLPNFTGDMKSESVS